MPSCRPSNAVSRLARAAALAVLLWAGLAAPVARAQIPVATVAQSPVALIDALPPLSPADFQGQFGGASYPLAVDGARALLGVGPRAHVLDIGEQGIQRVGETPVLDGIVRAVAFDGDLAFVGLSDRGGLHVFDLSRPDTPRELVTVPTRGEVRNLVVTTEFVYAAVFGGLRIFRRAEPAALEEIALELPYRGVVAVALGGESLYVLEPTAGLHVVSLAIPDAPVPGTVVPLEGIAPDATTDMRIAGDMLYIAAGSQVHVVDIAEPADPTVVAEIPVQGTASDLAIREDRLAVAGMEGGVTVFDLADPRAPTVLAELGTVQGTSSVAWTADGALLATDWLAGLTRRELTASTISSPDAEYRATTFIDGAAPLGDGTIAVTAAHARLMTLAPAASDAPGVLDIVDSVDMRPDVRTTRVLPLGDRLAVLSPHGGIWLYARDGSAIGEPAGELSMAAYGGASIDGGRLLAVAGGSDGLHIVAIEADGPRRVSTFPTDVFIGGVAARGDVLAVADRQAGLRLLSAADPARPIVLGTASTVGPAMDVALIDDAAYIVTQNGALEAFDIADPARPSSLGAVSLGGGVLRVVASGTTLYALVNEHMVVPVDVRRPEAPVVGAPYALPERIVDLAVDEQDVYVTAGKLGLLVGSLPVRPRDDDVGGPFDPEVDAPGAAAATLAASEAVLGTPRPPAELTGVETVAPAGGARSAGAGALLAVAAAIAVLGLAAFAMRRAAVRRRRDAQG